MNHLDLAHCRGGILRVAWVLLLGLLGSGRLCGQEASGVSPTILFVGNSFLYGHGSPVRFYRADTVTDMNGDGIGGVPALFKAFTIQAGRDFAVSLETSPGKNLDFHLQEKAGILGRPWDHVVVQAHSLLDQKKPGDSGLLVKWVGQLAVIVHQQNPRAEINLVATWSRADQTYPEKGNWHGQPIERMALDIRAGYDRAAAAVTAVRKVIPVGQAWNRAMKTGVADPNPYDGIAAGQMNLWSYDHFHASTAGYYLEALVIFAEVTRLDPCSLGKDERSAFELGLSPEQAIALQRVAHDEVNANRSAPALEVFKPRTIAR
jgi:hypothetical protein